MKKLIILFTYLLIPISAFSQPYFQKINTGIIATDSGSYSMCAWGDYNGDGFQDLVVTPWNDGCWSCRTPIQFYRNNGNGTFSRGSNILVDQVLSCHAVAWGDYDNDGKLDLFVGRYINQTNLLFHNDGNGDFSLVTSGSIVTDIGSAPACAWCDYDKDGWLDLFVSNTQNQNNALYHNNGNGTFTKITTGAVVNDGGDSRGCAWGDYDNDGWPDLFVANFNLQHNFLYHNNGNGTFTRVLNIAPVDSLYYSLGCCWFDYDNDGWLDLFVANNAGYSKMYHNNHNGTFTTMTNMAPSQEWGWSDYPAVADIDNDGWTDLFVPKRNQNGYTTNNALFKNINGADFVKLTSDIVSQEGGYSDAGTFGDFDNDGKMDLFVANGSSGGYTKDYFYKNVNPSVGNYITVRLYGCVLNRSAIGSRIRVVAGNLRQMHEVSGGNGSQSMLWQHFGVGSANIIDSIIITFTTGTVKVFTNVPVNQSITVTDLNCPLGIINNQIPSKFELMQNYPNPFNPTTRIKYSLMKATNVKLSVYDVMGRFINYIVNGKQSSGTYEYEFDGKNLASGIYIYKIETDEFSDSKKMVLIK
jgi:hypothetical protein